MANSILRSELRLTKKMHKLIEKIVPKMTYDCMGLDVILVL